MKIGNSNEIPKWGTVFAVVLGIPSIAALLRAGFEHGFHKLTAIMLTAVSLFFIGMFLHWKFKSESLRIPSGKEEQKREMRELNIGLTLFLAAVFLVGGGLFIWGGFQSVAEWPPISDWLLRIASFIIGGISLLFGFVFVLRLGLIVKGKRCWRLGKLKIGD